MRKLISWAPKNLFTAHQNDSDDWYACFIYASLCVFMISFFSFLNERFFRSIFSQVQWNSIWFVLYTKYLLGYSLFGVDRKILPDEKRRKKWNKKKTKLFNGERIFVFSFFFFIVTLSIATSSVLKLKVKIMQTAVDSFGIKLFGPYFWKVYTGHAGCLACGEIANRHTVHRFAFIKKYNRSDVDEYTGIGTSAHTLIWIMMPYTALANGLRYSEPIEYHAKESILTYAVAGRETKQPYRTITTLMKIEAIAKNRKQRKTINGKKEWFKK